MKNYKFTFTHISTHYIKFQKPNYTYRSSERVIHNERLFAAFQKIDLNNLDMSHCTNKVLQTNFPKCTLIHIFRTAKNPTFTWTMSNKSTWVLPIT